MLKNFRINGELSEESYKEIYETEIDERKLIKLSNDFYPVQDDKEDVYKKMEPYMICSMCKKKLNKLEKQKAYNEVDETKWRSFKILGDEFNGYFYCDECDKKILKNFNKPLSKYFLGQIGFLECLYINRSNENQQKWFDGMR